MGRRVSWSPRVSSPEKGAATCLPGDDGSCGRADLWRDLSALFAAGRAFDIYFRVIETGTTNVVLQSDCYRFVVRD